MIVEKIPLFLLSLIFIVLTIKAEANVGALRSTDQFSLGDRALNVVAAVPLYLKQLLLPYEYAAYYPIPDWLPWHLLLLITVFVALIWLCLRNFKAREPVCAGILWFLVCLLPVLGIIKIGSHLMADRYAYLAQIGIFVALVWTISSWAKVTPRIQVAVFAAAAAVFISVTHRQLPAWKDDLALALNGERVTGKNAVVCYGLGVGYELAGDRRRSLQSFREVTEHAADYGGVHYNIARACVIEGKPQHALVHLERALRQSPADPRYHNLMGEVLAASSEPAIRNAKKALEHASFACNQVQNRNPLFLDTLAAAYAEAGQFSDAVIAATGAMRLTPSEEVRKLIGERIQLYAQGKPFRGVLLHDAAMRKNQEARRNN